MHACTHHRSVLQNSNAQLQSALTAARTDLDWVVSEVKAGKLSHEEAEECIKQVSDSVPSVSAAALAVKRAQSGSQEEVWGWESAGAKAGVEGWTPKGDEPVKLIKLGGKVGKVTGNSACCCIILTCVYTHTHIHTYYHIAFSGLCKASIFSWAVSCSHVLLFLPYQCTIPNSWNTSLTNHQACCL